MIQSLVRTALQQRLVVVVVAVVLLAFGFNAARQLSVDAFPDVTNVQVQIATEAPGRSPEEVERFVTVPLEISMTGLPGLEEMRSLNKPGLSLITLVFTDATDVYFARQLVMERLLEVGARMPEGVVPVLGPVSTGLGEVYQYTLDHPDDGDRKLTEAELTERRIVQDWVVRPLLRSIPGVAEINSQGGYNRQYQVLVNPDRLRHYQLTVRDVYEAVARNNANSGGGILPQYAEQYLIRGVGLVKNLSDIGAIVLKEVGGTPVYVRDVAEVTFGHEVRQGAVVKNGTTEAVGGVVMMLRGGNAKEVVSRIQARVAEINEKGMLPDGLKIVPYYDRSELVDAALWTVTKVLLEGVVLVVVVLFLFLGDVRSSLIVVATLVLTPLLTFMAMNHYGISANLMSLGGLAIAIGLGPFLGIWLARTSSMTAVFWVAVAFAALALAILLALSRGLPGPDAEHASARHGWRTLLERRVLGLATVIFGCGIVNSAVITFLDPATRGTELAQAASWFFLVYAGVVLVWRPVGGVLQDRVGERPVLAPCLAALAVALGLLASAQSPAMIIAAAVAFGLGWGTITSGGQAAAVNRAPAARTGAAIGTFFFALDLGTGIGPILLGLLVDPLGYRWVFGLAALAAVLTVPLYLRDAARNVGPAS